MVQGAKSQALIHHTSGKTMSFHWDSSGGDLQIAGSSSTDGVGSQKTQLWTLNSDRTMLGELNTLSHFEEKRMPEASYLVDYSNHDKDQIHRVSQERKSNSSHYNSFSLKYQRIPIRRFKTEGSYHSPQDILVFK